LPLSTLMYTCSLINFKGIRYSFSIHLRIPLLPPLQMASLNHHQSLSLVAIAPKHVSEPRFYQHIHHTLDCQRKGHLSSSSKQSIFSNFKSREDIYFVRNSLLNWFQQCIKITILLTRGFKSENDLIALLLI
jgi:hypothetical protein